MTLPRLFPALMPGETIHSAVSRYHLLAGNVCASTSLIELFGNRASSLTSDFPSRLGELMKLPGADKLIDKHTLLPLFLPFIGKPHSELIRNRMVGRAAHSLKFQCGVMNAGFERYRAWRYCPDCMLNDSAEYGVAYWHVIHQAAGVQACPEHRVPLYKISVYSEILRRTPLVLPRSPAIQAGAIQYRLSPAQLANAVSVATFLSWGLEHPGKSEQLLARNFLNVTLYRKGLIHRNRINAAKLTRHIENILQNYPPDDEFARLGAQCQCCPPWILGTIRRQDRTHHPLFYFSLLDLLGVRVSELDAFIQENEVAGESLSSNFAVVPTPRKVSEEVVVRKRVQFAIDTREGGFRKAKDYSWLSRNDREWLSSYVYSHSHRSSHRGVVDWAVRDETLAREVQRARTEILSYVGKPIKITQRSLARHLCLPLSVWRRGDLLPKTSTALSQVEESAHDFQLRRITWAAKELDERAAIHTRSSLLRMACIRVLLLTEAELARYCS
ncbi:TnsD family Tn7-like transposition protein [Pseudomonas defluvii]|uniref:TnsD family Tn7-like transposition protein n=1 Tax=Pseudomonas defluvii TaxID=1876757 RepID=UPI003905A8F2